MAELIVPSVVDGLFGIVKQQVGERVNLVIGVEEEVTKLSETWKDLESVLDDAQRRGLKEKNVWGWLEELEDIAHDMEDLFDEWDVKILKPKDSDPEPQTKTGNMTTLAKKVRSFISSLVSCLKEIPVRSDIAMKIKEINGRLDSTLSNASKFHFVTGHLDSKGSERTGHLDFKESKPFTTPIFDEKEVYGRDSDKESLLKLLLPENSSDPNGKEVEKAGVKVISIVGFGGSGKTTMARVLFNDDRVKNNFELKKWVCISDTFDENRIANALLENPENGSSSRTLESLETIFQRLKNSLSGKKFLLVFDDAWNDNPSKWEPLMHALKDGAPGSMILVTTRDERVARAVLTRPKDTFTLRLLSDSDCWLILERIALSWRPELCKDVEEIGQKIAKKCKGLPLAAKVMGSLLQSKDNAPQWRDVLDSDIWQMHEAKVDLFPVFYLSYKELSPESKRCFTYCAVFPKDHIIKVQELIRLWMAQGYLGRPSRGGDEKMEKKGYEVDQQFGNAFFLSRVKNMET